MLWHVQYMYVFLVCGTTRSFLNTDLMDGLLTPEGEYCVDIADLQTKATFLIELSTCIDESNAFLAFLPFLLAYRWLRS